MFYIPLAAFFFWALLRFLEKGKDRDIDGWVTLVLVLVPALAVGLASGAIAILELAPQLSYFLLLLYMIIPACMLHFQYEVEWGRSISYGAILFVLVIVAQVCVSLFFGLVAGTQGE